ncbi:MAG: hypothetical protein A2150_05520 [Candidatus Muproteobacteria bacterium RBG_16_64_11]|uniref:Uncharacterized protein n=1 Tax=Candidatus Muproteobacteria bacterium RBG_16_64_11 TaxID=1817758 RepID=A0A1F6TAN8_9PROT|nr:MAG: hypothetical protein A2150_05520 [Candidatus Muproteobacteria bacterium RBG_16_64_11]
MATILPFKKPTPQQKNAGKTLCHNEFHKWQVATDARHGWRKCGKRRSSFSAKRFDVKQGQLVTVLRCLRCGKEKTRLL